MAKYPFPTSALPLLRIYRLETVPRRLGGRGVGRVLEAPERGIIPRLENPWVELLSFPYARALVNYDDWLRK